nr:MAG TPA: hypothetical protein [Caudoviricetes sp.]
MPHRGNDARAPREHAPPWLKFAVRVGLILC